MRVSYLAQLVRALIHCMRAAPSCVAVQWDDKRDIDPTLFLKLVKSFLLLRRHLNLIGTLVK